MDSPNPWTSIRNLIEMLHVSTPYAQGPDSQQSSCPVGFSPNNNPAFSAFFALFRCILDLVWLFPTRNLSLMPVLHAYSPALRSDTLIKTLSSILSSLSSVKSSSSRLSTLRPTSRLFSAIWTIFQRFLWNISRSNGVDGLIIGLRRLNLEGKGREVVPSRRMESGISVTGPQRTAFSGLVVWDRDLLVVLVLL